MKTFSSIYMEKIINLSHSIDDVIQNNVILSSWKFISSSIARQDDKKFPWTTEYFSSFNSLKKIEMKACNASKGEPLYPILIKLSRNRNLNNKIYFARVVKNRKKCANSIFIAVLVLNSLSHIHCDYQHSNAFRVCYF